MGNCVRRPKVTPIIGKTRRNSYKIKEPDVEKKYDIYDINYQLEMDKKMHNLYETLNIHLDLVTKYTNENKSNMVTQVVKMLNELINKIMNGNYPEEFVKKCTIRIRRSKNKSVNRIINEFN